MMAQVHTVPGVLPRRIRKADFSSGNVYSTTRPLAASIDDGNIVTSEGVGISEHLPVLDLDYSCSLVESSTPGHYHLYLDKGVTWRKYLRVLKALSRAGLIERGFYLASKGRGFTSVRLPWVKKADYARGDR